jgi:predicted nucleic acid-binding protein
VFLVAHKREPREVCTVTIGEFAIGARPAAVRRMFHGYRPLSLGRELAIFAGRLQADLDFELGENDLWIAATALRHDLPLVSRDRVFIRVPGLRVLVY